MLLNEARTMGKIGDLNTLRPQALSSRSMMTGPVGTPAFCAPEIQRRAMGYGREQYGSAADVWSLGCILVCMHMDSTSPYVLDADMSLRDIVVSTASGMPSATEPMTLPHAPQSPPLRALLPASSWSSVRFVVEQARSPRMSHRTARCI